MRRCGVNVQDLSLFVLHRNENVSAERFNDLNELNDYALRTAYSIRLNKVKRKLNFS